MRKIKDKDEKMSFREYVVVIYAIAFLIALGAIASIPTEYWKYISDGQKATMAIDTFLGFCGVLIAYWVYEDEQKMGDLEVEKQGLERRLSELERKLFTSSLSAKELMRAKNKKSLEERVSDLESNKKT